MEVFCRELTEYSEFMECLTLQEKVFQLSDLDKISPMVMALFARQSPPVGICIGAFERYPDGRENLIGLTIGVSTFMPNTLYCMMLGVVPEYRHHGVGIVLIRRLREAMIQRGIERLYAVYDPLDSGLGKLYFKLLGVVGIGYEIKSYQRVESTDSLSIPIDNLRIEWMIHHPRSISRFSHQREQIRIGDLIAHYPVFTGNDPVGSIPPTVLVRIPPDFHHLKSKEDPRALDYRMKSRSIFDTLVNEYHYWVVEFHSGVLNGEKHLYYQLERNTGD